MNRLLLGLGNDLLRDDSVGLRVVREVRCLLASSPGTPPARGDHAGSLPRTPLPVRTLPHDAPNVSATAPRRTASALTIRETSEAGLVLLDELTGFDDAILVDAVQTGEAPPGHVHQLEADDLPRVTLASPHRLGVGETLALARALELPMPRRVTLWAIEVEDPFTLRPGLTPAVDAALPDIARRLADILGGVQA